MTARELEVRERCDCRSIALRVEGPDVVNADKELHVGCKAVADTHERHVNGVQHDIEVGRERGVGADTLRCLEDHKAS
eukprot:2340107-Rhodomonas_salina.1